VGLVQLSDMGGGFGISNSPAFMVTDAPTLPIAQAKVTFDVLSSRMMSLCPLVPLLPLNRQPVKVAFAPSQTDTAPPTCNVKRSKRSSRDQETTLHSSSGIQGTHRGNVVLERAVEGRQRTIDEDCTALEVELKSCYILQSSTEIFKAYLLVQV
jgi:hypothetical protein